MPSKVIKCIFLSIFIVLEIKTGFSQNLNKYQIQLIANNLLISKEYKVSIKKILAPVNDIQVVLLTIPYREYPSIIIINKDKLTKKWQRTFECLSPGIQNKPSGLLDWHTVGEGVDFELGTQKEYTFNDEKVRKLIEVSIKNGGIIIPYQNFLHMNTSDKATPSGFRSYTIDKTGYFDFANKLYNNQYKKYPSGECMMFDSPNILDCELSFTGNQYMIKAITDNSQVWIYTFDRIDTQKGYLINKKISVRKN